MLVCHFLSKASHGLKTGVHQGWVQCVLVGLVAHTIGQPHIAQGFVFRKGNRAQGLKKRAVIKSVLSTRGVELLDFD